MTTPKSSTEINSVFASDDNPTWYYCMFYFNAGLAVFSTIISVFFIFTKTPHAIGSYKYFLLNITVGLMSFMKFTLFLSYGHLDSISTLR